jgi:hypothetical protein
MIERMTGGIIRAVALLCLASPVAAAADDQNAAAWLQPSSTWQVDYAEADCRLLRRFGEGDAAVYLELKRGLAFDSYAWTLYGAALPKYTERVDLTIALEPQGREYRVEALPRPTRKAAQMVRHGPDDRRCDARRSTPALHERTESRREGQPLGDGGRGQGARNLSVRLARQLGTECGLSQPDRGEARARDQCRALGDERRLSVERQKGEE